MLSDLLLATVDDAILGGESVSSPFRIDVKGRDLVKLSTLWAILERRTFDRQTSVGLFPEIFEESDDGPWIFEFPHGLDDVLRSIDKKQIHQIAEKWTQTAEFQLGNIPVSTAQDYLRAIHDLSLKPRRRDERLFLWVCL